MCQHCLQLTRQLLQCLQQGQQLLVGLELQLLYHWLQVEWQLLQRLHQGQQLLV